MKWVLVLIVSLAVACGNDATQKENNGFDVGETDFGADVGTNDLGADSGADMGPSGTITFKLTNDTNQTLYAGLPGAACMQFPFVKVQGIDAAPILSPSCSDCQCGDEGCNICDCAEPGPDAYLFEPGAELTFEWDKRFWSYQTQNDFQCIAPAAAQLQRYTAEFCFIDDFVEGSARPTRQLCTTVSFDIEDDEVRHVITDEDLPAQPTELRLINETGGFIFARPSIDGCYGSWLSMTLNGNQVRHSRVCGIGLCSEGGGENPCPVGACAAPMRETFELADGDFRSFMWNHVLWQQRDLEGAICQWPDYVAAGTELSAEICWATEINDDGFAELANETCETVQFNTSEPIVEFVVN